MSSLKADISKIIQVPIPKSCTVLSIMHSVIWTGDPSGPLNHVYERSL